MYQLNFFVDTKKKEKKKRRKIVQKVTYLFRYNQITKNNNPSFN